jgi:hypothetical protein
MSPLLWTSNSVRKLAAEIKAAGHSVRHRMVAEMLHEMDYSLQANARTREGGTHEDRDAQFEHIARRVRELQAGGMPVISVDTK